MAILFVVRSQSRYDQEHGQSNITKYCAKYCRVFYFHKNSTDDDAMRVCAMMFEMKDDLAGDNKLLKMSRLVASMG